MKKGAVLLTLFALILIGSLFYVSAVLTDSDKQTAISNAYTCLENRIDTANCSQINSEEKIFSLLSVDKCETNVISDSDNLTCWPNGNCKIKTTAQAILALNERTNQNTTAAENWLLSKKVAPSTLTWYLEVDPTGSSDCTVFYDGGGSYAFSVGENKKIDGPQGNCFKPSYYNYFLKISPTCYNKQYSISCNTDFVTTLIYQKANAPDPTTSTIYVLKDSHSGNPNGYTDEKINSYCFGTGSQCDYEGTLWASVILDGLGYDVSSYMPYIVSGADDTSNKKFLPEAFIYFIGKFVDYKTKLLGEQNQNHYWWADNSNSARKFYDTALALFPFQYESGIKEKDSTIEWLLRSESQGGAQEDSGCWSQSNIINNAFLLYSIFPESFNGGEAICGNGICEAGEDSSNCPADCLTETSSCISEGYNCVNTCAGDTVSGLDCPNDLVCCDAPSQDNCSDLGGDICSYGYTCVDGTEVSSNDLSSGETCCVGGTCQDIGIGTDLGCVDEGYYCVSNFDCTGEYLSQYTCAGTYVCCSEDTQTQQTCSDLGGDICTSDQYCSGGGIDSSDVGYGETCCISGTCKTSGDGSSEYTCTDNGGVCEIYSCQTGYEETTDYTCQYGDKCCIETGTTPEPGPEPTLKIKPKGKAWIWIIFVLIVLGLVAILFRDKLRIFLLKMKKSEGSSGPGRRPGPRGFPGPPNGRPQTIPPRRIVPSYNQPVRRPAPTKKPKAPGELDDVLKKLKEMGK